MITPDPTAQDQTPAEPASSGRIGQFLLWLLALSLFLALVPVYLISDAIAATNADQVNENGTLAAALEQGPPMSSDERGSQAALSAALSQLSLLDPVHTRLLDSQVPWPQVMASIGNYHDDVLVVLSLTQADEQMTISGRAWNETAVIEYADRLEASGCFARVSVQSIVANLVATPTPPPTTPRPDGDAPDDGNTIATPPRPSRLKYVEFVISVQLKSGTE